MKIHPIEGHDPIVDRFQASLARGRLGSAYLFVGPSGIGKRSLAFWLAQALLCEGTDPADLQACGDCSACQQVAALTHPDFELITKPEDKATVPVELLIGDKQHRMREGLCARIAMTPARGGRKVAIVDDADYLSQEAANCLLKTLEEPPPRSVLILIGTSAQRQLPTIRSRCQIVAFRPLADELMRRLVRSEGLAETDEDVAQLVAVSGGSLDRARTFAETENRQFYEDFCGLLAANKWKPLQLSKEVTGYVDAAGKEAPKRRQRLILVSEIAAEFFHHALMAHVGSALARPALADAFAQRWPHDAEALAAVVQRCLLARQHVTSNANQATNIEAWVDDLWQLMQLGLAASVVQPTV